MRNHSRVGSAMKKMGFRQTTSGPSMMKGFRPSRSDSRPSGNLRIVSERRKVALAAPSARPETCRSLIRYTGSA